MHDNPDSEEDDGEVLLLGTELSEKYALSLRMKAGFKPRSDLLIYGFAGPAHAKFAYGIYATESTEGGQLSIEWNQDFSSTGCVVGFGVEHKLNNQLSITGDAEYYNYGKKRLTWETNEGNYETNATPDYWALKIGLNYQF